jgi:hypothetical protein
MDENDQTQQSEKDENQASRAAASQTIAEKCAIKTQWKTWCARPKNWIALLTLVFVGTYTIITYQIFTFGNRALVYFDHPIIDIADEPVPSESNGRITLFNGPWVTQKVVRFNFSLTNAGNTPTKDMRVILDCRKFGFAELNKTDPFNSFVWDDRISRSEIIGPKQTIQVGPCEADTKGDTILNAQMGIVPIILMGEIRYEDRVSWFWRKHVTEFSQRLVISSFDPLAGKISATTVGIGNHNCADDCEGQ